MTISPHTSASTHSAEGPKFPPNCAVVWVRRATDDDKARTEANAEACGQHRILEAAGFDTTQITTFILLGVGGWRLGPELCALISAVTDGRVVALATAAAHRLSRNPEDFDKILHALTNTGTCRVLIAGKELQHEDLLAWHLILSASDKGLAPRRVGGFK